MDTSTAKTKFTDGYTDVGTEVVKKKPRRSKQTIKRGRRSRARGRSVYPSYAWRGYDPILDVITDVIDRSGETIEQIALGCGVSTATLNNYKNKYIANPRGSCVAAILRWCGAKYGAWYNGRFYEAKPRS